MLDHVVDRGAAVLRRGGLLSGAAPARPGTLGGGTGRRVDEPLPARASLRQLTEHAPHLQAELEARGRATGLLIGTVAALAFPLWSVFDFLLEPASAGTFTALRLASLLPVLAALWLLGARPVGRRHAQLLTIAVLALLQVEIAWMAARATHVESYLLGLSLALYGSGCLLAGRPRWTGGLVATTWAALAGTVLSAPRPLPAEALATAIFYLATASVIAVVAHLLRHSLAVRELRTRVSLEREQDRTRALLARLERLSHEDPLTGLANRRRWDVELDQACTDAREQGTDVAVVLLDLDHFKQLNDRHGHAGGDEALRQVAGLLRRWVRETDLVARIGGDELAVLLPGADAGRAVGLAEALREAAGRLHPEGFGPGEVTLSLGVGVAAGGQAFPMELMSRADRQLYRAKITRNAVAAAGPV